MRQIITSTILLGFFIFGCNQKKDKSLDSGNKIDSLDYVVISSAIEQFFFHPQTLSHRFHSLFDSIAGVDRALKREEIKMLLIADSTTQYEDSISQYIHQKHNEIDTSDNFLTEKIIGINDQKFGIDNHSISSFQTKLITHDEINMLRDSIVHFGYEKLYQKYSTAYGLITISRPAFTDNKDKAIIYIGLNKEPKSGQGAYLWLKKINDKWIAYDLVFLWES